MSMIKELIHPDLQAFLNAASSDTQEQVHKAIDTLRPQVEKEYQESAKECGLPSLITWHFRIGHSFARTINVYCTLTYPAMLG